MELSVVICSHNPNMVFLGRVFTSLKNQTLPSEGWELLLIDNKSNEPLKSAADISWHPNARHLFEGELGLTPARLRGIQESRGKVVVFVDDDNVLAPNYLACAITISERFPFLGAWGGNVEPEFQVEAPSWSRRYWPSLAIREVSADIWSNDPAHWQSQPCGAGLCARRSVLSRYAIELESSTVRRMLGRKGQSLVSGEDSDILLTARSSALGWGMFKSLRLIHLIPSRRLEITYLCELEKAMAYSWIILAAAHGNSLPEKPKLSTRIWKSARVYLREGKEHARIAWARQRGVAEAIKQAQTCLTVPSTANQN